MMSHYIESIKNLMSSGMLSKLSTRLEEKESNVEKAISPIIAGFLALLLKRGNTQQLYSILEEAGNREILKDLDNVCDEKASQDQQRIGDDFLQHLFGDKAAAFTAPIADQAGISKVAVNRLVSVIAPVTAGFLGEKVVKEKLSMADLRGQIEKQKDDILKYIPPALYSTFGLSTVLPKDRDTAPVGEKPHKSRSWIIWLVLILLVILIIILWRSCKKPKESYAVVETVTITEPVQSPVKKEMTRLTLPDGKQLQAYKGGIEDRIISFLQSDEYKKATENDLKEKWFVFDNMKFRFGSATELMDGYQGQLDNIVAILKYFKDAKVKVGGFADKKGTEEVNLEISQGRAKTVESLLEKGGIGSQVVKIEGYGEEYAKHNVNETDAQRAEDREVALRFVK